MQTLGAQGLLHVNSLHTLLAPAAAVAIAGAFAGGPPLWFCVLCPTVLGLLAPLAINFGLGGAAGKFIFSAIMNHQCHSVTDKFKPDCFTVAL